MENKEKTLFKSKHVTIKMSKNNKKQMILGSIGWLILISLIVWWCIK